jgi:hypothetical protein
MSRTTNETIKTLRRSLEHSEFEIGLGIFSWKAALEISKAVTGE